MLFSLSNSRKVSNPSRGLPHLPWTAFDGSWSHPSCFYDRPHVVHACWSFLRVHPGSLDDHR